MIGMLDQHGGDQGRGYHPAGDHQEDPDAGPAEENMRRAGYQLKTGPD
jgi:hypothetical protein